MSKVIIFVMTNTGMLVAPQIFLIWTGLLHLGIHAKKICVIGSFYTSKQVLQLRSQQILNNYFNGCRSSAGLSSENLGNDVKVETTTSASDSGSSLKVSIFYLFFKFI